MRPVLNPLLQYRLFEMIPGVLIWFTFFLLIGLSFIKPLWAMMFIIAFALLWLLRVIYFVIFIFIGWLHFRRDSLTPWPELLQALPAWQDMYHLIVLPTYEESYDVIKTSLESYRNADYPNDKIIIVLSKEQRARFHKDIGKRVLEDYKNVFFHVLITEHPDGIMGEMKGKGANAHWAGHVAKRFLQEKNIPYEKVIVSYFDVDTVVCRQYFAALTVKYLTHPNPTRTAFQPVVLYNNNMWDAPFFTRVAAFGTTFWLMTDLARPDRLFTFSSHAMSMKALVDVGFWQRDIVTDDSRIFLQGFIFYKGDFSVTPMYIPISMDTVHAETLVKTFVNLYRQQRRWAYGSEHFPYMLWHFFKRDHGIPFKKKIKYLWNLGEGMYSWATVPILIILLGYLPFIAASDEVKATALAVAGPFVLEYILGLSMIGIFVSGILSLLLLPPQPKRRGRWQTMNKVFRWFSMIAQWVFLPVTLLLWGAIPATEAQTRLMLGKYLGFWVTQKVRIKP